VLVVQTDQRIGYSDLGRPVQDVRSTPNAGDRFSYKTQAYVGLIHASLDDTLDIALLEPEVPSVGADVVIS